MGFLAGQPTAQTALGEAEANRQHAQTTLDNAREVAEAIQNEITQSQQRLDHCQSAVRAAAGEVLFASPEFVALFRCIKAWCAELRSLRLTIRAVRRQLTGLPDALGRIATSVEEIDERRVDFAVDEQSVSVWTEAIEALQGCTVELCQCARLPRSAEATLAYPAATALFVTPMELRN